MAHSFIREEGARLASLGYGVCAIAPGSKRPLGNKWGDRPLSPETCRGYPEAGAGVGIICGKGEAAVYGLDFDIEGDEALAEELFDWASDRLGGVGDVLKRVGRAPKFLIPVRSAPGMRKCATEFFRKGDARARLEVLAAGQQFVAYAIHPGTGKPYSWEDSLDTGLGLCIPVEYLPEINSGFLDALREKFAEAALAHGWEPEGHREAMNLTDSDREFDLLFAPEQAPVGLTVQEAEKYISGIDPSGYDDWLQVGMALHFEFKGSPDALDLWDRWSQQSENYKGFQDLQYRWERFSGGKERRRVTMRTFIARYNRKNGDAASEWNEKGLAARAADYYRPGLLFDRSSQSWFAFNGAHWSKVDQVYVESAMWPVLQDELLHEAQKYEEGSKEQKSFLGFYQRSQKYAALSNTVKILRTWEGMNVKNFRALSDPRYFGVANGDVDLETGRLLPPSVGRYTMEASSVAFDPTATCPLWRQTVLDVFSGDAEMAAFFQRIAGYSILGNPDEEVMFIFTGNGCNGKSTIVNALREVLGQAACTVEAETLISGSGGRGGRNAGGARADLLAVFGKRFVVLPETDEGARLREDVVKRLVSRDELVARGLYRETMESTKPSWVVALVTNYLPVITGDDDGIYRRLIFVPFTRSFDKDPTVKKDTKRAEKLRAEYSGILNWILDGVREYRRIGLACPKVVTNLVGSTRDSMDVLRMFIQERAKVGDKDALVETSVLWNAYQSFARANGYEGVIRTKTALTQRLVQRYGVKVEVRTIGGRSTRVYTGISLAEDALDKDAADSVA